MITKIIKYWGLLLIILSLPLLFYFYTTAFINEVKLNYFSPPEGLYYLKPITSTQISPHIDLIFPSVKIHPNDKNYWLITLKEKVELKLQIYDHYYIAQKRISEILRWGDIINWQINYQRFYDHMSQYLHDMDRNDERKFKYTLQLLFQQEKYLNSMINNPDKPEKSKLKPQLDTIFNQLFTELGTPYNQYNPLRIIYDLESIIQEKEFGEYEVNEINNQIPEYFTDLIPVITNVNKTTGTYSIDLPYIDILQDINWSVKKSNNGLNEYMAVLDNNIQVVPYLFRLVRPINNKMTINISQDIFNKNQKENINILQETIYPSNNFQNYSKLFYMQNNNPSNVIFKINSSLDLSTIINSVEIIPVWEPELIFHKIDVPENTEAKINFHHLPLKISLIDISHNTLREEIYVRNNMSKGWIILFRNEDGNTTKLIVVFWPFWLTIILTLSPLWLMIALLIWKLIVSSTKIFKKNIIYVYSKTKGLFSFFDNLCVRSRWIALFLLLLFIIFDFFYLDNPLYFIVLLASIMWIIVFVGFRFNYRNNCNLLMMIFSVYALCYIIDWKYKINKVALWLFLSIMMCIVHSFFDIFSNDKILFTKTKISSQLQKICLIVISKFYSIIIDFLEIIFNYVYSMFLNLIAPFTKTNMWLFNTMFIKVPNRPKDYIQNIISTTIILFVTTILFILCFYGGQNFIKKYFIYQQEKQYKRFIQDRMNLNPFINKIEPAIVYRGTKIIIFGNNFTSRQYLPALLFYQKGMIEADYFDNSKIIFTIPIDWQPGKYYFWIEKKLIWNNKIDITKSNVNSVQVIPVDEIFDKQDDMYFEQLKYLDKETLKINGYSEYE